MIYKYLFQFYLSIVILSNINFSSHAEENDYFNNKENTCFWLALDNLKYNNIEKSLFYLNTVLSISPDNKRALNLLNLINKPCNSKLKSSIWVKVSIKKQKAYVCKDSVLKKVMICSTSKKEYIPTPIGRFYSLDKVYSFYSPKYFQTAKYWVGFTSDGRYGFHSIPIDKNNKEIIAERKKLGTQSSHGCIRLSIEDAKWFYSNFPLGSLVCISE